MPAHVTPEYDKTAIIVPPCVSQRIQSYNKGVLRIAVPAAVALAAALSAQTAFFPLKDLKPGMVATGRTVFSGNRVEDFQVEILACWKTSVRNNR